jgi:hypothetical protein
MKVLTALDTVRQWQVPLLALVLLGACAVKLSRVLRARSAPEVMDAMRLFPPRLRRPASMALCAIEFLLGAALLLSSGRAGHGGWADGVRLATAVFFLIAMSAVVELRDFRPDLGCGCFGEVSRQPLGMRSVLRPGLLAAAALASVHSGEVAFPAPGRDAFLALGLLVIEVALLLALSPEAGEMLARLGYTEPCELRAAPLQRAVQALRRSRAWRQHSALITGDAPADAWRELCWWFLVYPGQDALGACDIVFAVEVRSRWPAIHAAVVARSVPPPAGQAPPVPPRPGPTAFLPLSKAL